MRSSLLRSGILLSLLFASSASAIAIDWTPVGATGNACDPQAHGCFGAVGYAYNIGTYEVTNVQYAAFLNAVAATDPNGLYNANMDGDVTFGGITRGGNAGSYSYSVKAGFESKPVNHARGWPR